MTILLPLAILGLISVFIIGGLAWDKKRQSRASLARHILFINKHQVERERAMSLNYSPRGDRVIVKRAERERVEPTGIALPDSQQRPLNSGTVIAVGPGARNSVTGRIDPIEDLKVGDTVEFLDYAGTGIEIDGQEYLCMRESEIHGKR